MNHLHLVMTLYWFFFADVVALPDEGASTAKTASKMLPSSAKDRSTLARDIGVAVLRQSRNSSDLLTRLGRLYNTDKATEHHFTPFYNAMFSSQRDSIKSLLEVGVYHGASIQMWRDYFPEAKIYGIDYFRGMMRGDQATSSANKVREMGDTLSKLEAMNPKIVPNVFGSRVKLLDINQSDVAEMDRATKRDQPLGSAAPFDIIIEDGSHAQRDQQLNLAQLFPLLKPGGVYVVEDVSVER